MKRFDIMLYFLIMIVAFVVGLGVIPELSEWLGVDASAKDPPVERTDNDTGLDYHDTGLAFEQNKPPTDWSLKDVTFVPSDTIHLIANGNVIAAITVGDMNAQTIAFKVGNKNICTVPTEELERHVPAICAVLEKAKKGE